MDMSSSAAAGGPPDQSTPVDPARVSVAAVCGAVACLAGGLATGHLLVKWGPIGAIALWGVGGAAGFIVRKIVPKAVPAVAWVLVAGCVAAYGVANVTWYHENFTIPDPVSGEQRSPTWVEAVRNTPGRLWNWNPITMIVGALCAGMGAQSAFAQVGRRHRVGDG